MPTDLPDRLARLADPAAGGVRLAFVGRRVVDGPWLLSAPAGGVAPAFFEARDPGLEAALAAFAPHVVAVLAPATVPAELVAGLDAVRLAVLTEPVALGSGRADPWQLGRGLAEDMLAPGAREPFAGLDLAPYDRVLAADPVVAQLLPDVAIWRSRPLPVDDALFLPVRRPGRRPRPLFLGASTPHREDLLVFAKHAYDVRHFAFGLTPERLREQLAAADVGIVLNPGPAKGFVPEVLLHLAAGHLVVAEELAPTRGLEPGLDHLVARAPHEVTRVLDQLAVRPSAWEQVRLRGRARAEEHRASRAWPRLLADLAADLRAFGTDRAAPAPARAAAA